MNASPNSSSSRLAGAAACCHKLLYVYACKYKSHHRLSDRASGGAAPAMCIVSLPVHVCVCAFLHVLTEAKGIELEVTGDGGGIVDTAQDMEDAVRSRQLPVSYSRTTSPRQSRRAYITQRL